MEESNTNKEENLVEISPTYISAFITDRLRSYRKAFLFNDTFWELSLTSEPNIKLGSQFPLNLVYLIYRVSDSNEVNQETIRTIYNALNISINEEWLKTQSGDFLICTYPNSKIPHLEPYYMNKLKK